MSMSLNTQSFAEKVADEVRAHMARKRRTGGDLAKHLGISQPTMSKRLNGETPFDLCELAAVAEWLGVEPAELLVTPADKAAS